MSEQPPFIELVAKGFIDEDKINDFIDYWHDSNSNVELHEFLGLSWAEYSLLALDSGAINTIITARRYHMPLTEAVNDNIRDQNRIAARSDDPGKIARLHRWIATQPDR